MKLRLAFSGVLAALIVALAGLSTQAIASSGATSSASQAEKNADKASKKAKKTCKKAKKVKKSKSASSKEKKKARKNCDKANKNAKKQKDKLKEYNKQFFDVCKHGCKYNTIQKGVDAAGTWQFKNKNKVATVRIQPGTYVEGVFLHGKQEGRKYNNLKIIGVKTNLDPNPNARKVILEGTDAKTVVKDTPGWLPGDPTTVPANNAIEGRSTTGLVMKNMWARNYQNNTFFVWASNVAADDEYCADFVMDNLASSDTRSYGLFSRNCFGGKMINSEGWNHGDSALYIGETPCDSEEWTNRGPNPGPCQVDPKWTLVRNFKSHQNVLGYSGTNSKYVKIKDSSFYNNGAGIVPNTLDSEKFEPNGWMILENNDVFWNNYNYFSSGSEFSTVSNGLGELLGSTVNYPMGVGIALFGSDGIEVKNNRIFGNEKWGAMTFSAPVFEPLDVNANDDDDAKSMNNLFTDNQMGRNGLDPNGVDFLNDNTGGGNCWSGNTGSPNVTYVPGNGSVPQASLYPACPQTTVINQDTLSYDFGAGIQADLGDLLNPNTILGYVANDPPRDQECSWNISTPHPGFTDSKGYTYTEKRADPVPCP